MSTYINYTGVIPPKMFLQPIYRNILAHSSGGAGADYPLEDNVRSGTNYGSGAFTGNMTEPAESDVKTGVSYGANGTEFTGTLAAGGGEQSSVSIG